MASGSTIRQFKSFEPLYPISRWLPALVVTLIHM
jgi:hypothetical protein